MRAVADRDIGSRAVWCALAVLAVVATLHASDVLALVAQWRNSYTYSHGFLVAAVLPWLVWREREGLGFERRVPVVAVAMLLAAVELFWLLARGAHVDVVRAALLPVVAWVALLGILGPRAAWRLAFPLAWFWCAVPIWDVFGGPLQHATAVVDRVLLGVIGIPALLDGSTITVPAGSFEVAAACSGLNFFMVAITIATLVGQVRRWGAARRATFVGIAALIAIVSNWVRVCLIIAIGQWTDMQSSLVREGHYMFGWWMFAAALVLFLYLTHRWDRSDPVPVPHFAAPAASGVAIARRAGIILALVAAGPAWAGWQDARARSAPRVAVELPGGRHGWSGPEAAAPSDWIPAFVGATIRRTGVYERNDVTAVVDITYYAVQGPGAKLVGYPSNSDGPARSTVLERHQRAVSSGPGRVATVEEIIVQLASGRRWRVWQWFQVGDYVTARPMGLKMREALAGIVGTSGSAAVSIAVECVDDCRDDRERAALAGFAADMQDSLFLAAAGGRSAG